MNQLSLSGLKIEEGLLYAFPCSVTNQYQIGELRKIEGNFAVWVPLSKRKKSGQQYYQRCLVSEIKNMEAGSWEPRIRSKYL